MRRYAVACDCVSLGVKSRGSHGGWGGGLFDGIRNHGVEFPCRVSTMCCEPTAAGVPIRSGLLCLHHICGVAEERL